MLTITPAFARSLTAVVMIAGYARRAHGAEVIRREKRVTVTTPKAFDQTSV
jgi:hypothetical protein